MLESGVPESFSQCYSFIFHIRFMWDFPFPLLLSPPLSWLMEKSLYVTPASLSNHMKCSPQIRVVNGSLLHFVLISNSAAQFSRLPMNWLPTGPFSIVSQRNSSFWIFLIFPLHLLLLPTHTPHTAKAYIELLLTSTAWLHLYFSLCNGLFPFIPLFQILSLGACVAEWPHPIWNLIKCVTAP